MSNSSLLVMLVVRSRAPTPAVARLVREPLSAVALMFSKKASKSSSSFGGEGMES